MKKPRRKQQLRNPREIQDRTLRFLSYRPRSMKEVEDYLRYRLHVEKQDERGYLMEKLIRLNFLDDKGFVHWWVERRHGKNPRGMRVIRQELRLKGIAQDVIDEVLREFDVEGDVRHARRALEKKLPMYRKLTRDEYRRKATAFLIRRGFDWETVQEIVRSVDSDSA